MILFWRGGFCWDMRVFTNHYRLAQVKSW